MLTIWERRRSIKKILDRTPCIIEDMLRSTITELCRTGSSGNTNEELVCIRYFLLHQGATPNQINDTFFLIRELKDLGLNTPMALRFALENYDAWVNEQEVKVLERRE